MLRKKCKLCDKKRAIDQLVEMVVFGNKFVICSEHKHHLHGGSRVGHVQFDGQEEILYLTSSLTYVPIIPDGTRGITEEYMEQSRIMRLQSEFEARQKDPAYLKQLQEEDDDMAGAY